MEYNMGMSFIRRFFYYITSTVFRLLLLVVPVFFALTFVFSTPSSVQDALKQSGVYDQFVDLVLDASAKENKDAQAQELLNNADIRAIAKQAFNPELLERSSNNIVTGVFDWLNGKTPQPQFTLDLSSAKTTLTQKLSEFAEKRAAGLPTCTAAQLQTLDLSGNLLTIPCLPPGVTAAEIGTRFSDQLLTNADFLDKPVITNQTLTDQNNGKPITDNVQSVPEAYQAAQKIRWAVLGLLIILGLLLVFARRDRRAGLRHVAWALITTAVFLIIALLAYWYVFNKVGGSSATTDKVQSMVLDGTKAIFVDLNKAISWFAVGYAVAGTATLLLLKYRFKEPEPIIETNKDAVLPEPEKPAVKPVKHS